MIIKEIKFLLKRYRYLKQGFRIIKMRKPFEKIISVYYKDESLLHHYIINLSSGVDVKISELMQGIPIGGELNFLDEGTISAGLKQRKSI